MVAHNQDTKTLRRDIYSLRRVLRRDMAEIREALKENKNLPTDALTQFRQIEKSMREKAVSKQSKKELLSTYRQLKYIRGLKTSTLSGVKKTADVFSPIAEKLDVLSPKKKQEFWSTYGKLYIENPLLEKFKYEIFLVEDVAILENAMDSDDLVQIINDLYEESRETDYGTLSEEEISLLFSQKLSDLYSKLK